MRARQERRNRRTLPESNEQGGERCKDWSAWEGAMGTVLEERGVGQDASSYTLLACGRRCFFPFTSWNFDIYVRVGRGVLVAGGRGCWTTMVLL